MVKEVIDQKEISLRQLSANAQTKAISANMQSPFHDQVWQRCYGLVSNAAHELIMRQALLRTGGVLVGRTKIMLVPTQNEEDILSSYKPSDSVTPQLLNFEVDMLLDGRVIVSVQRSVASWLAFLQESERAMVSNPQRNKEMIVVPLLLGGWLSASLEPETSDNRAIDSISRASVHEWFTRKGIICPSHIDARRWTTLHIRNDAISSNHSSTPFSFEWPLQYCASSRQFPSRRLEVCSHFDSPNIFEIAIEWMKTKAERKAPMIEPKQETSQLPPIPSEVCHDADLRNAASPSIEDREGVDLQASSIYPTPPDGPLSQQTPASNPNNTPNFHSSLTTDDPAVAGSAETDTINDKGVGTPSPPAYAYEGQRSQSVNPVRITEDDFEFFNDPMHLDGQHSELRSELGRPDPGKANSLVVGPSRRAQGQVKDSPVREGLNYKPMGNIHSNQLEYAPATDFSARYALSEVLTKTAVGDRLDSITALNSKYSESGAFENTQDIASRPISDRPGIPRVGFPSSDDSASSDSESTDLDSETGSMVSESLAGVGAHPMQDEPAIRRLRASSTEICPKASETILSSHEEALKSDISHLDRLEARLRSRNGSNGATDPLLLKRAYPCEEVVSLLADFDAADQIEVMQIATSQILHYRANIQEDAHAVSDFHHLDDIFPNKSRLDLISLMMSSTKFKPAGLESISSMSDPLPLNLPELFISTSILKALTKFS